MTSRKKVLIILGVVFVLTSWFFYESRYFNKVEFLSPIDFKGDIPIRNDIIGRGEFGAPRKNGRIHAGLDILGKIGTPVKAIKSGRVINAEMHKKLGNYVEIKHWGGLITIYSHLSKILVKKGERVLQGQIVGQIGKTGNAQHPKIKPHLHFEIRKNRKAIDPAPFFELY